MNFNVKRQAKNYFLKDAESTVGIFYGNYISTEPAHDKTFNKTCVYSKGSDQPVWQGFSAE